MKEKYKYFIIIGIWVGLFIMASIILGINYKRNYNGKDIIEKELYNVELYTTLLGNNEKEKYNSEVSNIRKLLDSNEINKGQQLVESLKAELKDSLKNYDNNRLLTPNEIIKLATSILGENNKNKTWEFALEDPEDYVLYLKDEKTNKIYYNVEINLLKENSSKKYYNLYIDKQTKQEDKNVTNEISNTFHRINTFGNSSLSDYPFLINKLDVWNLVVKIMGQDTLGIKWREPGDPAYEGVGYVIDKKSGIYYYYFPVEVTDSEGKFHDENPIIEDLLIDVVTQKRVPITSEGFRKNIKNYEFLNLDR